MAHEVTPSLVRATATLARIELHEDEVAPLVAALSAIVTHVATLDAAPDRPEEGLRGPGVGAPECPLRDDVVTMGTGADAVRAMAPALDDGCFLVPRFGEP